MILFPHYSYCTSKFSLIVSLKYIRVVLEIIKDDKLIFFENYMICVMGNGFKCFKKNAVLGHYTFIGKNDTTIFTTTVFFQIEINNQGFQ